MNHIYTFHAVEINTDWTVFYASSTAVLLFWKAYGHLQGVFPHKCYRIPCFIMLVYSNGAKVYKTNIIMIMHNTGYGGRTNPIFYIWDIPVSVQQQKGFSSVCELKLWNTLSDAPKQRPRITLLKKWLKKMIFVKHKDVCISLYMYIYM